MCIDVTVLLLTAYDCYFFLKSQKFNLFKIANAIIIGRYNPQEQKND